MFRATEQWFCSVDSIKEDAVKAINDVEWIPQWGRDRITSMVPRPERLVHLPPAAVGRADPCPLLRGLRRAGHEP